MHGECPWERLSISTKLRRRNIIPTNANLDGIFCKNEGFKLLFSKFPRGRKQKKITVCLWEYVVWLLWRMRNALIFHNQHQ